MHCIKPSLFWGHLLALLALTGSLLPGAPAVSTASRISPTRPDLASLAAQLPSDPLEAVQALVETIYGPDEAAAQAAVGELLQRAGLPLVSIQGPLVGLPTDLVLRDAAVYAELLPDLTRAVRRGDFYTPQQVSDLLTAIGLTAEPLAPETLVAGLGQWGKKPGSPLESQVAGAAVRALAGRRLQVLYIGADLDALQLDPLQTLLILAHATSRAATPLAGPAAWLPTPLPIFDRLMGVQSVAFAAAAGQDEGPCDALEKALTPPDQIQETIGKAAKDALLDSWKEFALSEKAREALGTAGDVYEKGSAVLNTLLLLMGTSIEVSDNKGGATHFAHAEGQRDRHVKVTAVAYFDSSIAKEKVACYKLAGIEVPPPGRLAGYRIRWSISQSQGRGYQGKFLSAIPDDSHKIGGCGTCGEVTGADGQSTVELYPPVEKPPGKGKEQFGGVHVTVSLDKDDFPFKLSDLLALTNPAAFAAGKTWDLAISAIQKAGLPSSSLNIRVGYHASEIYVAKGGASLFMLYVTAPVQLDIWTCEGLTGGWKGHGGMGGDAKAFLGVMAETITGVPIPENVQYIRDFNFVINPQAVENVFGIVPEGNMNGILRLDQTPTVGAAKFTILSDHRVGRPVGEVEIRLGDESWPSVFIMSGSMVFPLYWVPEDPHCPPGEAYFENYP